MPAVENVPDLSAEEKENRETSVELSTMIPAFCRPMNVMKKPIEHYFNLNLAKLINGEKKLDNQEQKLDDMRKKPISFK